MTARIRSGRVVLSLAAGVAAVLALAVAAPASHEPVVTQAHSGKTFRLTAGRTMKLRLAHRWSWTTPKVSSRAVMLTPVNYVLDPGFSEWVVTARVPGKATIRSTGKPGCTGCALTARAFVVTFVVR